MGHAQLSNLWANVLLLCLQLGSNPCLPLITINSWKQYFISMNAKSIGKRVNLGFWSTFFTNSEAVGASYFKQSWWSKVGKKRSDFFKMLLSCYKFQFKCYISLVKIQNCHILFRNVTTEIFLLRPLQWWAESAPLGWDRVKLSENLGRTGRPCGYVPVLNMNFKNFSFHSIVAKNIHTLDCSLK